MQPESRSSPAGSPSSSPECAARSTTSREGGGLGNREEAAFAVTVLAHEATHLRGIRNEATTECYALQEGAALGTRLGLSPAVAHELMQSQLDRDLGNRSVERLGYRLPAECRNGGALDLRPEDATFP